MKSLKRSRSDRVLFGVCGGFGEYFGVNADIVRVAWVLLGLTGVGVIPYLAAIFLMPESEGEEVGRAERMPRTVGLVLIAVGGFAVLRQLGIPVLGQGLAALWSWKFFVPLLFVLTGVLLIWPRTRDLVGFTSQRQLRRSVSNRVLAGVAGGIAEETGVDANLVRIAAVLLVFMTSGIAAILYLLLILVLPEEEVPVPASAPPAPSVSGPAEAEGTPAAASSPAEGAEASEEPHDQGEKEESR